MSKRKAKQPTLAEVGEHAFLARVQTWFTDQPGGESIAFGIGDDCALLTAEACTEGLAVTLDNLIEDVHFRRDWISPRELGARSLAVNLSDLAAMGARPVAAFLGLSVPSTTPVEILRQFFFGLRDEARRAQCPLAGGDMTAANQWAISITVMGRPASKRGFIRRDAARPGDALYVTGTPGRSGAGLAALKAKLKAPSLTRAHFRPEPRLAAGAALARICPRLAMIDLSDGIWNDAGQIARASGCALEIDQTRLPLGQAVKKLAGTLNVDPLDWVLEGGEDYELLFATDTPEAKLRRALDRAGCEGLALHRIGSVCKGEGVRLIDADGKVCKREAKTFRHF